MVLFKKHRRNKGGAFRRLASGGKTPGRAAEQTVAAAPELCTRMVLIEKLTEQVKVCRVHMVRQ